jgi:RluA family pseudouridine synthase
MIFRQGPEWRLEREHAYSISLWPRRTVLRFVKQDNRSIMKARSPAGQRQHRAAKQFAGGSGGERRQPAPARSAPPPTPLVLYEDAHLLIIDKPAGLAVHAGPATPVSLEDCLPALRFGFQRLPQPAHRLDRDTSGCLALGRSARAQARLGEAFAAGDVAKTYIALLPAHPPAQAGRIAAPILKRNDKSGWTMVVDAAGQPATTLYRVLADAPGGRCWVALRPLTGRTHQLRVHAAHLGLPIVGDTLYAGAPAPRLMLHAAELRLPSLAAAQPPLVVRAPWEPAPAFAPPGDEDFFKGL